MNGGCGVTGSLLGHETTKYERIWALPGYGRRSPGLRVAEEALAHYRTLGAMSLTDYGCGDGQALAWFSERDVGAVGFDLVDVPRDSDAPFYAGTLWDPPPELPTTDFAFSSDVLEHLPTEHVVDSLAEIRTHTRLGGFVQVCTVPDGWGAEIGETLHLTVRDAEWWRAVIADYFTVARAVHDRRNARFWLTT